MQLSALCHVRSVCYLTHFACGSENLDQRSGSRTPELQFLTWLTPRHSVLNIVEMLSDNIDRAVSMPVDKARSSDPSDPVHGGRVDGIA